MIFWGEGSWLFFFRTKIKSLKDSNFDLVEKRDEFNALRMGSWYKAASGRGSEGFCWNFFPFFYFIFLYFSFGIHVYLYNLLCGEGIMELRIKPRIGRSICTQQVFMNYNNLSLLIPRFEKLKLIYMLLLDIGIIECKIWIWI